jgi:hypothetical protein
MTLKHSLEERMETLANLESFVRSAEAGGFSAAARRLSLTPAAVSRNSSTFFCGKPRGRGNGHERYGNGLLSLSATIRTDPLPGAAFDVANA